MPRFLNAINQELCYPLTVLFRIIIAGQSVPDDWKVANVAKYRPISLNRQLCKVFETVARDQLIEFVESE